MAADREILAALKRIETLLVALAKKQGVVASKTPVKKAASKTRRGPRVSQLKV